MSKKSRNRSAAPIALAALLLAACGSAQPPAEPRPVADTVFGEAAGTLDKARSVEGTVMQQKEDLDRTLQENEQSTAE
jgi:hypothetical protein